MVAHIAIGRVFRKGIKLNHEYNLHHLFLVIL